ncbi:hypothetical protein HPB50_026411 [Hyalomma asiaticum]|uniref:Uncharacterized protein n=1 Tax=Hyalomma asiaticum TaxID=266040 RepID=A0ACB7SZD6_HYAAI|nr:hypothetical protein HPB50_026411 [Hyalomma asiaticum]
MAGGDDASIYYPQGSSATPTAPPDGSFMPARSSSRGRSRSRRRAGSRKPGNTNASRSRSRSRSQTMKRATWADTIKGSGGATSTGTRNTAAKKKTIGTVSETYGEDEMAEPSED